MSTKLPRYATTVRSAPGPGLSNGRVPTSFSFRQRQMFRVAVPEDGQVPIQLRPNRILRGSAAIAICSIALSFWTPLRGQTNTSTSARAAGGNRYLLVIETSKAMGRRSENVVGAVGDLLASGMGGQLRRGDTLGVWTYNEALHTGRFPLQRWSPEKKQVVNDTVIGFLESQKYEKQPHFEKVFPMLQRVVADSECITVILVSDGTQPVQGTPFDKPINDYFERWRSQQQQNRMPFLALLRGQGGVLTNYAMAASPWRLEFPPLTEPPKVVKASTPETKKPAPTPTRILPPLIVSGKKPQPTAAKPAEPATAEPRISAAASAPNINADPLRIAGPTTAAVVPKPGAVPTNDPPLSVTSALPLAALTTLVEPTAPARAETEPPQASSSRPQQESSKDLRRSSESSDAVAAVSKKAGTGQPSTPALSTTAEPQTNMAPDPKPGPAPTPVAVTIPGASGFGSRGMWLAAVAFGLVAVGVALWWRVRPRRQEQTSLITRSLDR